MVNPLHQEHVFELVLGLYRGEHKCVVYSRDDDVVLSVEAQEAPGKPTKFAVYSHGTPAHHWPLTFDSPEECAAYAASQSEYFFQRAQRVCDANAADFYQWKGYVSHGH